MKRFTMIALILAAMVFLMTGCCLSHTWQEASCTGAAVCSTCGKTGGEPAGHSWQDADCENPRRCPLCDEPDGAPLGHSWQAADCVNPETCTLCGETQGEALGHSWQAGTCDTPEICSVCAQPEGEAPGHDLMATAMYADRYEGVCRACGEAMQGTADAAFWTEEASEEILGTWYAALMQRNGRYHYVRKNKEMTVEFFDDGTLHLVMGTKYDEVGTWEFAGVNTLEDGSAALTYAVEMPDGEEVTFTIRTYEEKAFAKLPKISIPAGYTLSSYPNRADYLTAFYTRQKQT